MVTEIEGEVVDSSREVFMLDVGFKNDPVEVEYEGQVGLICEGYASKYNEEDAAGETQLTNSFADIAESWGAQKEPLVLYNHGLDPVLGARPIGRGIAFKHLHDGLYVKVFVPRDASDNWKDKRAQKKFKEIYSGVKSALIRAFSVGGSFIRYGSKLARWSTTEISLTPTPCLASATFSLGSKAVIDRYGAVPLGLSEQEPKEQSVLGKVTRQRWNSIMGFAKQDGDVALHDHLLGYNYEPQYQGKHDSEDCPICADRREMMGVKAVPDDEMDEGTGTKAVTKSEDGTAHSSKCYLIVENPNQPTTWHLRVRNPDGSPNHRLMGAAKAALVGGGFRGNKYEGPGKQEAIRKLKALYKSEGLDWESDGGSGGKSDDLDAQEILADAQEFLVEFNRGVKAGAKHSRETKAAVRQIIDHLVATFGLNESKDSGEGDD